RTIYRKYRLGENPENIDLELSIQVFPHLNPLFMYSRDAISSGEITKLGMIDANIICIMDCSCSMREAKSIYKAGTIAYALAKFSKKNNINFEIYYFQTRAEKGDINKVLDFRFPSPYGGTILSSIIEFIKKRGITDKDVIFILSDFMLGDVLSEIKNTFSYLTRARRIYLISVGLPRPEKVKIYGANNIYFTTYYTVLKRQIISHDLFQAIYHE
ncbi:MAG: hypothetical protein Q6363_010175, partial [Candidatus Njordarchaeota archaeon]